MYPKPELVLRHMSTEDLQQVMRIDQLSFEIPWSENSYRYEIEESDHSFMVVLDYKRERPLSRWQRWIGIGQSHDQQIAGYGGMWNVIGEAHISTIAVHPHARGRGWGEILLAGMIRRSIALEVEEVGLEVRVSNARAQNLYKKYGFVIVNTKAHYYRNNNEDAYDMRLDISSEQVRSDFVKLYKSLTIRHNFTDQFSNLGPVHKQTEIF